MDEHVARTVIYCDGFPFWIEEGIDKLREYMEEPRLMDSRGYMPELTIVIHEELTVPLRVRRDSIGAYHPAYKVAFSSPPVADIIQDQVKESN